MRPHCQRQYGLLLRLCARRVRLSRIRLRRAAIALRAIRLPCAAISLRSIRLAARLFRCAQYAVLPPAAGGCEPYQNRALRFPTKPVSRRNRPSKSIARHGSRFSIPSNNQTAISPHPNRDYLVKRIVSIPIRPPPSIGEATSPYSPSRPLHPHRRILRRAPFQRVARPVAPQKYDENAALSGTIPQNSQRPSLVADSLPRRRRHRLLSQNGGDDQAYRDPYAIRNSR